MFLILFLAVQVVLAQTSVEQIQKTVKINDQAQEQNSIDQLNIDDNDNQEQSDSTKNTIALATVETKKKSKKSRGFFGWIMDKIENYEYPDDINLLNAEQCYINEDCSQYPFYLCNLQSVNDFNQESELINQDGFSTIDNDSESSIDQATEFIDDLIGPKKKGKCEHKAIFPILQWEFQGMVVLPFLMGLSGAAGIGGGGLLSPFCMAFWMFDTKDSIALSGFVIFMSSIVRYVFELCRGQRHPEKKATAIDYGIVIFMVPLVTMGSFIGVSLNIMLLQLCIYSKKIYVNFCLVFNEH